MIRDEIEKSVRSILGIDSIRLLKPQNKDFGDYSFHLKSSPGLQNLPVNKIREDLTSHKDLFEAVTIDGDFVNLKLSNPIVITQLQSICEGTSFVNLIENRKKETWLIEHTSPNPNKAMHLGHLRNNLLGEALAKIWSKIDITVIKDCVDNDRGIAIAKLMWGYLKFARKTADVPIELDYWHAHKNQWELPEDLSQDPGRFIETLYVQANDDVESNKASEAVVRAMVVDWEHEDAKVWDLWKLVLSFSYQSQERTLKRLGSSFDKVWHEHDHYKEGKNYVEKGLKEGVFTKTAEGTVITNLEKYGFTDSVLIKSDGTSLYLTQDIALTALKIKTFTPDRLFWVIGNEQSLAMQQVFSVCEQLGIVKKDDCTHISYGLISIKGKGKMSSRKGNVIFIEDLLDEVRERIVQSRLQITGKTLGADLAESLALGAVKYSILKVSRNSNIAFDIEESINFEGNSGPYLQYTHARIQSILKKADSKGAFSVANDSPGIAGNGELPRHLLHFPEIVAEAAASYGPHLICNYAYDLAKTFNTFYESTSILKATGESRNFLIALTHMTAQVLQECLALLGIEAPQQV